MFAGDVFALLVVNYVWC